MSFLISMILGLMVFFFGVPLALGLAQLLGAYTTVEERQAKVFTAVRQGLGHRAASPAFTFSGSSWGPRPRWCRSSGECRPSTCASTRSTCAASR